MPTASTPEPVIRQIVEAMRALAGPHPGFRPVHAKGLVCSGTFRASADAPRVTRAPHFAGQSVPTIVRFANANGNPDVHDGVPNVRSMAVKFQLSDGRTADILANSVEGFIARTLYHAEHAFRFTAVDGTSRFGRYRFVPHAGEAFLSPDDAGKRSPSFLREELEGRLRTGPAAFRLLLQLAEAGDPTDDVTALWPEGRPVVELGRLEVTGISPTSAADERRLIFDPTNRTDGIDLSADPILLARSAAYAISYDRRSKGE